MAGARRTLRNTGLGLMDRDGRCGRTLRVGIPISGKIKASCASQLFGVSAPRVMSDELISVIDLAGQYGKRQQTVFKVPRRLGIETKNLRSANNRGQVIAYTLYLVLWFPRCP